MPNGFRLRNSAATAVVALVVGTAVAVPAPARAGLFSKIVGSITGSSESGAGACSAIDAMAIAGWVMNPIAGIAAAASQIAGVAGDADGTSGCPVIEDEPLAIQKMTEEQRDELLEQGEELVRMNAPTTADLSGDIIGGVLASGDQAKAVGLAWSPDAADERFSEQYPESYEGMSPEQMAGHGNMQAMEAREAARTSKRTSAAAVGDIIDNIPTELNTLNAELRACEGINCSIGVMAQMVGLSVKVGVLNAVMDAGHYRANESLTDSLFSAREQALQDRRLNNGEVGGATVGKTPEPPEPEPIPEPEPEPDPEPIFDPTIPVS